MVSIDTINLAFTQTGCVYYLLFILDAAKCVLDVVQAAKIGIGTDTDGEKFGLFLFLGGVLFFVGSRLVEVTLIGAEPGKFVDTTGPCNRFCGLITKEDDQLMISQSTRTITAAGAVDATSATSTSNSVYAEQPGAASTTLSTSNDASISGLQTSSIGLTGSGTGIQQTKVQIVHVEVDGVQVTQAQLQNTSLDSKCRWTGHCHCLPCSCARAGSLEIEQQRRRRTTSPPPFPPPLHAG